MQEQDESREDNEQPIRLSDFNNESQRVAEAADVFLPGKVG